MSAFIFVTLALVAVAVLGAARISKSLGVTAVHTTPDRVFVAVGDEVVIATHEGSVVGVATDEAGAPWSFEAVSGFAVDSAGNLYVADGDRGEVIRFDRDGRGGVRVPMLGERSNNFEIAVFQDGRLAVADTRDHRVSIIAPTGEVLASQRVTYPNGLTIRTGTDGAEVVYVLETGARRFHAFDSSLRRVEPSELTELRAHSTAMNGGAISTLRLPYEMLDFVFEPGGTALVNYCRDTEGDCTTVSLDAKKRSAVARADLSMFDAELTSWGRSLMKNTEVAPGPNGRVYVASPVFASVVAFDPPSDGSGLCENCTRPGVGLPRLSFEELWSGQSIALPNGASVSLFGDEALRERYAAQWRSRAFYERVENVGRYGVIVAALVLLGWLFALRQSGLVDGARAQRRIAEVFDHIVRPDAQILGLATLVVAAGAAVGGGAGFPLFGASGVVPMLVGGAFVASRCLVTPLLVRGRRREFATEAWRLQHDAERLPSLALVSGETIEWVAVGRRVERIETELKAANSLSEATDPLDVLEAIAPRTHLFVRTNRRLIMSPISVFGAPVDAIAEMQVEARTGERAGVVLSKAGEELRFEGPDLSQPREVLEVTALRYLCERCGASLGDCAHSGGKHAAAAVFLGGLCPGLGHLLQYRFRRARALMLVALTFLFGALYEMLPQLLGTVPYAPVRFAPHLAAYVVVWAGALADVIAWSARQRRRAELTEQSEASVPDYAGPGIG